MWIDKKKTMLIESKRHSDDGETGLNQLGMHHKTQTTKAKRDIICQTVTFLILSSTDLRGCEEGKGLIAVCKRLKSKRFLENRRPPFKWLSNASRRSFHVNKLCKIVKKNKSCTHEIKRINSYDELSRTYFVAFKRGQHAGNRLMSNLSEQASDSTNEFAAIRKLSKCSSKCKQHQRSTRADKSSL